MFQQFGEIDVLKPRGAFLSNGVKPANPIYPADQVLDVRKVLAQLEELRARGVRVVLVNVDNDGGHADAARWLYGALRRFSEAGGTVVVHVRGKAASGAALFILAGDLVVLDPEARVMLHGACKPKGEANARDLDNEAWTIDLLTAETLARRSAVESWIKYEDAERDANGCPPVTEITPEAAVLLGFADLVAPEGHGERIARALAGAIASGQDAPRFRRRKLEARGIPRPAAPTLPAAFASSLSANVPDGTITKRLFSADAFTTTDYAEDTDGNPTDGAKMFSTVAGEPPIKVAPAGIQIGRRKLSEAWFQRTFQAGILLNLGSAGQDNSNGWNVEGAGRITLGSQYGSAHGVYVQVLTDNVPTSPQFIATGHGLAASSTDPTREWVPIYVGCTDEQNGLTRLDFVVINQRTGSVVDVTSSTAIAAFIHISAVTGDYYSGEG